MNKEAEKLANLIEKNPECLFEIDNDVWYMTAKDKEVTDSKNRGYSTDWYAHSSNYGAGIAEALIVLLNRRGFKIEARGV